VNECETEANMYKLTAKVLGMEYSAHSKIINLWRPPNRFTLGYSACRVRSRGWVTLTTYTGYHEEAFEYYLHLMATEKL